MDFGAISYFLSAGDFTEVDLFFAELHHKIKLLEHHTETTHKLYEHERIATLAKIKEEFAPLLSEADKKYAAAMDEIEGTEAEKTSYADHMSEWSYLVAREAAECEVCDMRFADMANVLYNSQIIAIYVLLEAELKRLCNAWQKLTGAGIALADFGHRDYLGASQKYLDKVVGIDKTTLEEFENKLTDLQNLRNRLIHDGGTLPENQLPKVKKLVESSKGGLITQPDGADHILRITKVDYITEWFSVIRSYFEQLFWVIDASMGNRFLKKRLQYLFNFINPYISVDITGTIIDKPVRQITFMINCTDAVGSFDIEVLLEIKNSTKQQLKIVNKTSGIGQIDRFKKVMDENNHYFWGRSMFGLLLTDKKKSGAIIIK